MAVMRALCERGVRVPEDVSVLSYCGEEPLGPFTNPPLTTLELDMAAYGRKVAEMLEEQFGNPHAARRPERLKPELVVRSSTTKAKDVDPARRECHVA
jgi:LacI family transcriptional regulator